MLFRTATEMAAAAGILHVTAQTHSSFKRRNLNVQCSTASSSLPRNHCRFRVWSFTTANQGVPPFAIENPCFAFNSNSYILRSADLLKNTVQVVYYTFSVLVYRPCCLISVYQGWKACSGCWDVASSSRFVFRLLSPVPDWPSPSFHLLLLFHRHRWSVLMFIYPPLESRASSSVPDSQLNSSKSLSPVLLPLN